ncbi:MAG: hypothetical protein JWQ35_930, partial [Bacteriovoracaceae bacterium]|nr:hypothetical protein [Bacteriovoracaceae bacterium]
TYLPASGVFQPSLAHARPEIRPLPGPPFPDRKIPKPASFDLVISARPHRHKAVKMRENDFCLLYYEERRPMDW